MKLGDTVWDHGSARLLVNARARALNLVPSDGGKPLAGAPHHGVQCLAIESAVVPRGVP